MTMISMSCKALPLLASRVSNQSNSHVSTLLLAFLLVLALLSLTSIPFFQSLHARFTDIRILQVKALQIVRLHYRTQFRFFARQSVFL